MSKSNSSGGGGGGGCGCVCIIILIFVFWAIFFGVPIGNNKWNIDLFPPRIWNMNEQPAPQEAPDTSEPVKELEKFEDPNEF